MSDGVQEKSVELAEAKAGVKLQAGHPVVLLVNGLHGTRKPESPGEADGEESAAPAASDGDEPEKGEAGTPLAAAGKSDVKEPAAGGSPAPGKTASQESGKPAKPSSAGGKQDAAAPEAKSAEEPLGHISLRLLDASGTVPLADKEVTIDLGAAGKVTKKTDADGKVSHPGVAIQDYELAIGEARVMVPAIPTTDKIHDQVIPGIKFGFVKLAIRDAAGDPLALTDVELEGPEKVSGKTDASGNLARPGPLPPGQVTVRAGQASATIQLPASPWETTIVRLQ